MDILRGGGSVPGLSGDRVADDSVSAWYGRAWCHDRFSLRGRFQPSLLPSGREPSEWKSLLSGLDNAGGNVLAAVALGQSGRKNGYLAQAGGRFRALEPFLPPRGTLRPRRTSGHVSLPS